MGGVLKTYEQFRFDFEGFLKSDFWPHVLKRRIVFGQFFM